jgi:Transcriptional regulator PadR-like family
MEKRSVLNHMKQKKDVQQGTLALMVLKTLDVLGPLHGYAVARRIEQISGDLLSVNQGTLYPVLPEAGTGRSNYIRLGYFGQQSQGSLLSIDADGIQAARIRKARLGRDSGYHRTLL